MYTENQIIKVNVKPGSIDAKLLPATFTATILRVNGNEIEFEISDVDWETIPEKIRTSPLVRKQPTMYLDFKYNPFEIIEVIGTATPAEPEVKSEPAFIDVDEYRHMMDTYDQDFRDPRDTGMMYDQPQPQHIVSVDGNEITITPAIADIYVKFEDEHWIVRREGSLDHCYSLPEAVKSVMWSVEYREKDEAHMAQLEADHEAAMKDAEESGANDWTLEDFDALADKIEAEKLALRKATAEIEALKAKKANPK